MSNLGYVVNNEFVNKTVYDKLVAKVNAIDTNWFILKAKYDTDKSYLENIISDSDKKNTSGFFKKTFYNAKFTEVEGKIPSIPGLTNNTTLTSVET